MPLGVRNERIRVSDTAPTLGTPLLEIAGADMPPDVVPVPDDRRAVTYAELLGVRRELERMIQTMETALNAKASTETVAHLGEIITLKIDNLASQQAQLQRWIYGFIALVMIAVLGSVLGLVLIGG